MGKAENNRGDRTADAVARYLKVNDPKFARVLAIADWIAVQRADVTRRRASGVETHQAKKSRREYGASAPTEVVGSTMHIVTRIGGVQLADEGLSVRQALGS